MGGELPWGYGPAVVGGQGNSGSDCRVYQCGRVGDLKLQSRVCFAGLLPLQVVGCVGNEGGFPWVLGAER